MAQCVVDYAHEHHGYAHAPDYLVGSQLFPKDVANCTRKFLRSMVEPTADGNRSSGCWHPKFDVTVRTRRACVRVEGAAPPPALPLAAPCKCQTTSPPMLFTPSCRPPMSLPPDLPPRTPPPPPPPPPV